MSFGKDTFVKVVDTHGNFRYGYIANTKDRGFLLIVDLNDEGYSKINWDDEYAKNVGEDGGKDFRELLTETELKLIPLLSAKNSTQDIADYMGVAPVTIRAHIRNLKNKLQLENREQLFAYCQGIVKKLGLE
jgi:DNA-binding CsgD family transcriptional regulator